MVSASFSKLDIDQTNISQTNINQRNRHQTLHNRGCSLLDAGQYKEALSCFEQAIAILPDQANTWYKRGDALAHLAHHEQALFCFNQVLALESDHQQAWAFRGAVLLFLGRYLEALESCDRALILQPNDSETWVMRGAVLHRMGKYQQAYASYDKALGIERKPLLKQVIKPALFLIKPIKRLLSCAQKGRNQVTRRRAMLNYQASKPNRLTGWTISMGFSSLLLTAIAFVALLSVLQ